MTMISDLTWDLVEAILSKVPITCIGKVRSTCKRWNSVFNDRILCKTEARHQFLGFMVNNFRVCSVRFDLHGIFNQDGREGFAESSIKQIGNLVNHVEIRDVFHCDGLLLCVTRDNANLVVWNPYLGQTRWIQPRSAYHGSDRYALGYDNHYNKNRNHKIVRYFLFYKDNHLMVECEIYDFKSDSWRVLDVTRGCGTMLDQHSASLKGNAYFLAERMLQDDEYEDELYGFFLLCFDFTKESFGQFLHLPESHHDYNNDTRKLSSLREEKLVVLFQDDDTFVVDIWVTTKIEPNAVSWSKFLKFDMEAPTGFVFFDVAGFFIEEEKKLAVVFDVDITDGIGTEPDLYYNVAYIIGENGYLKEVDLGEAVNLQESPNVQESMDPCPVAYSSSYVPSLVQINQIT